jgi:diadenylate cyclase
MIIESCWRSSGLHPKEVFRGNLHAGQTRLGFGTFEDRLLICHLPAVSKRQSPRDNLLDLPDLFSHLTVSSIVDILLVASIFFGLFYLMQGTRAVTLVRGILLLTFAVLLASTFLRLPAFTWLIRNSIPAMLVAIPVIFQPELRRALERLGRPSSLLIPRRHTSTTQFIATLSRACGAISKQGLGALLVLERNTGLQEYVDTGVLLDAEVTVDLILTIFNKGTPLHDGAVIIRDERILAAGCTLPLSENPDLERELGTRHRAGVGITETTDAIAIIISEESGVISVAQNARLTRYLDEGNLNRLLTNLYIPRSPNGRLARSLLVLNGKPK